MEHELKSLMVELQTLTEGLKKYVTVEAVMRLRALAELAENLGTDALLNAVAVHVDAQKAA